MKYEYIGNLMG